MDIVEVARQTGIPASTLRFYEKKGLIRSVGRDGLRRRFSAGVLDQLALIALGQSAGFSLDEIRAMLTPDGEPHIDRAQLRAKADELDATIRRLIAMRDGLRHAAACPAPRHTECASFRKLVKAAASGALDTRRAKSLPRRGESAGD
ncbi:MAG: helix-turn-helix domain-containing protein [Rhodocyclaceae bacterium]